MTTQPAPSCFERLYRHTPIEGRWRDPSVDPWPKCGCGCGLDAPAATRTDSVKGYRRGFPNPFRAGHGSAKAQRDLRATRTDPETGCIEPVCSSRKKYHSYQDFGGRDVLAHRYHWELERGPIPEGYHLHHRCENTRCVNVEHLELLTASAHMTLHKRGKPCTATAKLSSADVEAIRQATGSTAEIAARFGISRGHTSKVRNRKVRPNG